MLTLSQLIFDPASTEDSANVGAYLRAEDGTLLTHTTVGPVEALDINIAQSVLLDVQATDFDIRDLTAATDNVAAWLADGTGNAITSTTGFLDVNIAQSVSLVVTATDLDIRDLTHVSDSVKIGDGTDFLAIDASGNIGVTDAGGSLTVDATDLDIRDLTAASDSVAAWLKDGAGTAITSTAGALDVNIASSDITIEVQDEANTAMKSTAAVVTTTPAVLLAAQLAARKYLMFQNNGSADIFVGDSLVTNLTGIKVPKGGFMELRLGPALSLKAVAASGTQDIRVLELS